MSCDLQVTNESACCWEEISSYTKIWTSSVKCFRFCPTYLTAKQPVFLRRSRSRSGQTKVGEWGWEQSERLGREETETGRFAYGLFAYVWYDSLPAWAKILRAFDHIRMLICALQAIILLILLSCRRLEKRFCGKKTQLLEMYNYFCGHLISRKEKMWVKK